MITDYRSPGLVVSSPEWMGVSSIGIIAADIVPGDEAGVTFTAELGRGIVAAGVREGTGHHAIQCKGAVLRRRAAHRAALCRMGNLLEHPRGKSHRATAKELVCRQYQFYRTGPSEGGTP